VKDPCVCLSSRSSERVLLFLIVRIFCLNSPVEFTLTRVSIFSRRLDRIDCRLDGDLPFKYERCVEEFSTKDPSFGITYSENVALLAA